jgi:hypothetical protein
MSDSGSDGDFEPFAKENVGAPLNVAKVPVVVPVVHDDDEDDEDDEKAKWNCNQIRTKLRKHFESGKGVQSHWLKENHVNSNSYGRFMKLKGPWGGADNGTFWAANRFFKKLERQEAKRPAGEKKRKREEEKQESQKKRKVGGDLVTDMDNFTYEKGPVYDDCNEVRRKINAFMKEGVLNKSQFCKILDVNTNTFARFLSQGPLAMAGGSNGTYPAAYHFFEKRRLLEDKPKSKTRLENEAKFPHGHALHHDDGRRWVSMANPPPYKPPSVADW